MNKNCPCFSGKIYKDCCEPYHKGAKPETALKLMRSRYAAYALNLAKYIIETTHPKNPFFSPSKEKWEKEILAFSLVTQFLGLEILENIEGEKEAFVTFRAILKRGGVDSSFIEKSRFLKWSDFWLYRDVVSLFH